MPPDAPASRSAWIGVACTLVGAIGFSGKTVFVKLAYQHGIDTLSLLALRMLFALPFFLVMIAWAGRGGAPLARRDWLSIIGLGFIGYYLGSYLDLAGLQYISAGLGRLILYLYPTVVLVLAAVFLQQPVRARHLVSLALSYGGIVLVFRHEAHLGEELATMAWGAVLVFGSAVTYAVYLIAGSRLVQKTGSLRFTAYASTAATVFVLVHFLALGHPARLAASAELYGIVLGMAVFSTVLPLWLMAEGLKRLGANQVALIACVGPLATIVMAHFALGEPITAVQIAGAALVLAGVMVISAKPQAVK